MISDLQRIISCRQERLERQINFYKFAAGLLVFIGFAAAAWGILNIEKPADLGSFLQGATGSLFALAGLTLIYVAFLGQKQQLHIQQDELAITRIDLEEQKAYLQKQEISIGRQNFEASFFQLLNLQNEIASQMRQAYWNERMEKEWLEGRTCFNQWYRNLKDIFDIARAQIVMIQVSGLTQGQNQPVDVEKCYLDFYKTQQEDLGHYFRTLFHLIKLVKSSEVIVEYKDKRRYTSLVRAQLSAYELALLFYNGLSKHGKDFKPWIEEFGLLEHLDREMLLDPSHEALYDLKAFK